LPRVTNSAADSRLARGATTGPAADTLFLGKQWEDHSTSDHLLNAQTDFAQFLKTIVNGPYMDFLSAQ
jgi:hypothetical protein